MRANGFCPASKSVRPWAGLIAESSKEEAKEQEEELLQESVERRDLMKRW